MSKFSLGCTSLVKGNSVIIYMWHHIHVTSQHMQSRIEILVVVVYMCQWYFDLNITNISKNPRLFKDCFVFGLLSNMNFFISCSALIDVQQVPACGTFGLPYVGLAAISLSIKAKPLQCYITADRQQLLLKTGGLRERISESLHRAFSLNRSNHFVNKGFVFHIILLSEISTVIRLLFLFSSVIQKWR